MKTLRQSSLILQKISRDTIKCVQWNPVFQDHFVFLSARATDIDPKSGSVRSDSKSHVYLWRGETRGIEAIEIPAGELNLLLRFIN